MNSYSLPTKFRSGLSELWSMWGSLGIIFVRNSYSGNVFFSFVTYQSGIQRDISAKLCIHNFISMRSFFISETLVILCLYYCLVSVTLVRITDQILYVYCKTSLNIRTILIIFSQYFYVISIFNVSFSMCLLKRVIIDVCNVC